MPFSGFAKIENDPLTDYGQVKTRRSSTEDCGGIVPAEDGWTTTSMSDEMSDSDPSETGPGRRQRE